MSRSIAIVVLVIAILAGATTFLAVEFSARDASGPSAPTSNGAAESDATEFTVDDAANPTSPMAADAGDADVDATDLSDYERMRDEFIWALGGHYLDKECVNETVYHVDPETGATREAQKSTCTPTAPEHPYRSYTTEALESLAYSDPVAAVVLGQRMWAENENVHKTVDMMMRATALSDGQWGHLRWLTNQRFSGLSRNGVPDTDSIHARYVLETVMDNFRTDGGHRDLWYAGIQDVYVIPDADIQRLEQTADRFMQRIRQIQLDVKGLTDMEVDEHGQPNQTDP